MLEPHGELRKLKVRFPGFEFRLIPGRGKERFEAVRIGGSDGDGLYAVISTDPAEVAAELKRVALRFPHGCWTRGQTGAAPQPVPLRSRSLHLKQCLAESQPVGPPGVATLPVHSQFGLHR